MQSILSCRSTVLKTFKAHFKDSSLSATALISIWLRVFKDGIEIPQGQVITALSILLMGTFSCIIFEDSSERNFSHLTIESQA